MIGLTLGHYRIESKLGEGGMGVVYKAADTRLGRPVAVKVLPADAVVTPERKRRFVQEARAASALNHPSILHIYDIGTDSGADFIAMEYVEGTTLDALIDRRGMDVGLALKLAVQIADGLAAAHAAGIVHRDIKPANIMVTPKGAIKILDFGIATLRERTDDFASQPTETAVPQTETGAIVGTIAYMSPEQAEGKVVDARADIFAFGAVLYEMLTGRRALSGASSIATLAAVLREDPPPVSQVAGGVSHELSRLIARCLRKDPLQRLQLIADVKLTLDDMATVTETSGAAVPGAPRRRGIPLTIAMVVGGAVLGIGMTIWLMRGSGGPDPHFAPLATEAGQETQPAWSPDGKTVAYLADVNGIRQVLTRSLASTTPAQITKTSANCDHVFWHPDGTHLYYTSGGKLWLLGIAGGDPRLVIDRAGAGSVSPDGKTLAVMRDADPDGALWLLSAEGADAKPYSHAPFPDRFSDRADVRFSPDGSKIGVALSRESGGGGFEFWIVPYPSGSPKRVLAGLSLTSPVRGLSWMSDSRHLVFSAQLAGVPGRHLYSADADTGAVFPLTPGTGEESSPSVSSDGARIAFVSGGQNVDLIESSVDGGPTRPLLATGRDEQFPAWSPTGGQYAYASNANGAFELWIRGIADGWARAVVTTNQDGLPPWFQLRNSRFSPDGKRIAFELWGPMHSIWITPVGSGRALQPGGDSDMHGPSWSPDGNQIAYTVTAKDGNSWKLVRAPVGGAPSVVILDGVFSFATEWVRSRAGEWIAFSNAKGVHIVSPDGAQRRVLTKSDSAVFGFSRDSSILYVVRQQSAKWELLAIDVDSATTRKTTVLDIPSTSDVLGFSLSPDGSRFATSVGSTKTDIWVMEGFAGPVRR